MAEHSSSLDKYLTKGERVVVGTHRHWFTIAEPLATATFGLMLIGAAFLARVPTAFVQLLLVAWLVAFGRAVLRVVEWNAEWFIATDQRLLLVYGFIIRKVDMLPIGKVTDMTYRRSVVGRMFGFGTFVLESAGADQALSDLHFIPDPDETYLRIVATIFKTDPDEGLEEEIDEVREELYEDGIDEDDPTARPSLRKDLARLGRRREEPEEPAGRGRRHLFRHAQEEGPVVEHRRRFALSEPDYGETLYSSHTEPVDPWDEDDLGPHVKPRRWWRR